MTPVISLSDRLISTIDNNIPRVTGNVPLTLLLAKFKIDKDDIKPKEVGILPENLLFPNNKYCNGILSLIIDGNLPWRFILLSNDKYVKCVFVSMLGGQEPVKELKPISKCWILDNKKNKGEIVLVKIFELKSKYVNCTNEKIPFGIFCSKLLLLKSKYTNDVILLMLSGIEPVMEVDCIFKYDKEDNRPMADGIVICILDWLISRYCNKLR